MYGKEYLEGKEVDSLLAEIDALLAETEPDIAHKVRAKMGARGAVRQFTYDSLHAQQASLLQQQHLSPPRLTGGIGNFLGIW